MATCLSCFLLFIFTLIAAQQSVEKWNVFELQLSGPVNGNPFVDVELYSYFTSVSNTTMQINGFYDGNGSYKIRFMPVN